MEFDSGKRDFSEEFQTLKGEALDVAGSRGLQEAVLLLMGIEKKCRVENDGSTLKEVCLFMVQLCREKCDWAQLNSTMIMINKRRNQTTKVLEAIVHEGMKYLEETPDEDTKVELIKTLKEICKGKMFVEAEDARLHLMLAQILEGRGDVGAACDMIQDVHVETYGSLSKKEKAEYILEQMRLNLKRKDYVRMLIQSRKMNRKVIEGEGFSAVKVSFYQMMINYHTQMKEEWEVCQAYYKIYDTADAEASLKADALQSCVVFLLLSKFDNHQSDMMHRIVRLKDLEAHPEFMTALTLFTTTEVIPCPFPSQAILQGHACVGRGVCGGPEEAERLRTLFRWRIVQHNIRVISKYYTRVRTARMATMLGLTQAELEKQLSDMFNDGDLHLKIDRPAGIVSFVRTRPAEEVLSDWTSDIAKMLGMVESTCHLINREMMVHKVA